MGVIARSCSVCGTRVADGRSRCPRHRRHTGRARSCLICGARTDGPNHCPDHTPTYERTQQTWRDGYNDPTYAPARRAALRRAGYACEQCKRTAGSWCPEHGRPIRLEADHINPLADGASPKVTAGDLEVLCACCCHTDKTVADRRARKTR